MKQKRTKLLCPLAHNFRISRLRRHKKFPLQIIINVSQQNEINFHDDQRNGFQRFKNVREIHFTRPPATQFCRRGSFDVAYNVVKHSTELCPRIKWPHFIVEQRRLREPRDWTLPALIDTFPTYREGAAANEFCEPCLQLRTTVFQMATCFRAPWLTRFNYKTSDSRVTF